MSLSDEYTLSDSGDFASESSEYSDRLGLSWREAASVSELDIYRMIQRPVVVISLSVTSFIEIGMGSLTISIIFVKMTAHH